MVNLRTLLCFSKIFPNPFTVSASCGCAFTAMHYDYELHFPAVGIANIPLCQPQAAYLIRVLSASSR